MFYAKLALRSLRLEQLAVERLSEKCNVLRSVFLCLKIKKKKKKKEKKNIEYAICRVEHPNSG